MGFDVVAAVEAMAFREKQPPLHGAVPVFEWLPGVPINCDDKRHDDNYALHEDEPLAPQIEGNDKHKEEEDNNDDTSDNEVEDVDILERAVDANNEVVDIPEHILDDVQEDKGSNQITNTPSCQTNRYTTCTFL